jgi:hypothetical protein
MRQAVCALIVLLFAVVKSNGQENRLAFGIKAGPSYTGLSENPAMEYLRKGTFKWAFHGGVFLRLPLSKYFSIQPELNYSGQGQKTEYVYSGYRQQTEVTLQYITVPLLINVKGINIQGTKNINIQVGAQYGYLLSGDEPFDYPQNKQMFASHDFSLCGGLSVNFTDNVSFGARYTHGLTDINYLNPLNIAFFSIGPYNFPPFEAEKNRIFQVFVSYLF